MTKIEHKDIAVENKKWSVGLMPTLNFHLYRENVINDKIEGVGLNFILIGDEKLGNHICK